MAMTPSARATRTSRARAPEFDAEAPDTQGGVDNAFGAALGGISNGALERSVNEGSQLVLMQLDGVDDLVDDDCVRLSLYTGRLPTGVPMPSVGGDGRLSPGQMFDLSAASFEDRTAGTRPLATDGSASIVAGRVRAAPSSFRFGMPFLSVEVMTTVDTPRVEFDVLTSALAGGVVGGIVDIATVIAAVDAEPALVTYREILTETLSALPDTDTAPVMTGCEAASVALRFSGVDAVRGDVLSP